MKYFLSIPAVFTVVLLLCGLQSFCQHDAHHTMVQMPAEVESQPLLAQALRLKESLSFLGSGLSKTDGALLEKLQHEPLTPAVSKQIQKILDPYCLAEVDINPESRVKVARGDAAAKLIQNGWVC